LERVIESLHEQHVTVDVARTEGPGHATEMARAAVARGETMVVAAGGDGTIAEVAQGLMGGRAALGVVPLGTANVLAHERGLPFRPAAIARMLAGEARGWLWPGVARTDGGERVFVQMCGIGFDASVVARLPLGLKRVLGRGAYVVQTLRTLVGYRYPRLRLAIDGVVHEAASAVIGKGRFYAGPYTLLPGARPGAAGFQVALFRDGNAAAVLLYGALLPLGLLWRAPGVRVVTGRTIEVLAGGADVQADGDSVGVSPLRISDAAGPIALVVP
jgi:diacylglycerol kinase family enzyme